MGEGRCGSSREQNGRRNKGSPQVSSYLDTCRDRIYRIFTANRVDLCAPNLRNSRADEVPPASLHVVDVAIGLVLGRAFLLRQLFRELGELRVEFRKLFGDVVEGFLQLFVV